MSKVAIVCIGGGMRSAHAGGFLYAYRNVLNAKDPDIVVGSSGSAGNLLYFATGLRQQCEEIQRIWCNLLSTPKFISLARVWRIMDIDYLVDQVFRRQAPFNTDVLATSTIEYRISITNAQTGEARYVSREDGLDLFEVLRASKALPFFYGKTVALDGGRYLDGKFGQTIQDHIDVAVSSGATAVILLDDSLQGSPFWSLVLQCYALSCSSGLRKAVIRDASSPYEVRVPEGVRLLHIKAGVLPTHILGRNQKKLRETFERGVEHAEQFRTEIESLVNE